MARPKKETGEALAATAAEMNEDVKETGKKETAPKKTAGRKPAAKKTESVKAEAEETEPPKKTAAKKSAAKKASEPEMSVTIQFKGRDIVAKDVMEAAKKAYMEANPDGEIKSVDIYVKPEDNVAYYAVNGEGSEDYKIQL